ncbi:protein/nucleic acid deglycase 2-like [Biomphalaria glabrata]|uniref:Protein/nucleic acid deglycase 2-like n=1 Tax=Biomphalaria glabrata TaxID=6526 RepID=A0A9W2YGM6_BIOGL|nr:protein/nucleic acid deglycase 2-like [Biomphalaria glabrata]KAI8753324.1 putative cysteine protease YraA [Biomphalaria glabrata]
MSNRKIGILVEFNFEDAELIYPYYRMKEAGFETVLIGPVAGKQYNGKHGYPATSEVSVDNISAQDLCALIIPGGWAPDYWRRDQRFLQLVKDMDSQGKILATICHGAWMLCSAKILKGRKLTCFCAIKDDVENAGGLFEDSPVVIDGNLITSRLPKDLPDFCKAILSQLEI